MKPDIVLAFLARSSCLQIVLNTLLDILCYGKCTGVYVFFVLFFFVFKSLCLAVSDSLGRRIAILMGAIVFTVGGFVQAIAYYLW